MRTILTVAQSTSGIMHCNYSLAFAYAMSQLLNGDKKRKVKWKTDKWLTACQDNHKYQLLAAFMSLEKS